MKMPGFYNVPGKTRANLLCGQPAVHIREHIDAPLALRIDRDPRERRFFSRDHFNSRKIESIFREGAGNKTPALVIPNEPEPAGFRSQSRNLGEIVARDASGMNLEALCVDLFF